MKFYACHSRCNVAKLVLTMINDCHCRGKTSKRLMTDATEKRRIREIATVINDWHR